jgi:hypothetical protein
LFTNEDNPNPSNQNLRDQARQRAKDLAELGIDIELFAMKKAGAGSTFDPCKFYQNIISISDDEDTGRFTFEVTEKFKELQQRVRRKEFKKRAMGRLPLIIGDSEIAVRLYVDISSMLPRTILHTILISTLLAVAADTNYCVKPKSPASSGSTPRPISVSRP